MLISLVGALVEEVRWKVRRHQGIFHNIQTLPTSSSRAAADVSKIQFVG